MVSRDKHSSLFRRRFIEKEKKGFIALVAKILEAEGFKVRSDLKFINGENNHRYP